MKTKPFEKLEVGKTYLTRSGERIHIHSWASDPDSARGSYECRYPFSGESLDPNFPGSVFRDDWAADGRYSTDLIGGKQWDLVSEVVPENSVVIAPGPATTKSGLEAFIYTTDAPDKEYPVIGHIVTSAGHLEPTHWSSKGEWVAGKPGSPRDLVIAPEAAPTLREAAEGLLERYLSEYNRYHDYLADPEQETAVKNLRAALNAEQP